ncbi:hypothetical protein EI613_08765 [Azospirillum sp. 412522]|nr:hypothetical protein [Azospirillum sp. 412522]
MLDTADARSLHLHSLDSLLADLVSGRPVGLDADGMRRFALQTAEARALLDWYWRNRPTWSKAVGKELLPLLVEAAAQTPPDLTAASAATSTLRSYLPIRIEIFRFGGVQEYDCDEPLVIDFDKPLLLLEGHNGCGKTSILNAVVWCLTGKLYRAQRAPADGHESVPLAVGDSDDHDTDDAATDSALVCPVPPKTVLDGLDGKPLPLDTQVAITVRDAASGREITLRRRLYSKPSKKTAKPEIETSGFEELGLDPVAFAVGTTMPGLLPHIRIGAESDLGKAIAELTGLAPLRLMVKHARRARERIEKELIGQDLEGAIEAADERYLKARSELAALIAGHPTVAPVDAASVPSTATDAGARLAATVAAIRQRQADAYADARAILGAGFDPKDATARQQLDVSVTLASAALDFTALAALDGAATLKKLGELDEVELVRCETTIVAFRTEAQELLALAADPAQGSRLRLYARVGNWQRDAAGSVPPDTCPTCLQPFDDRIDPATGRRPCDHLAEARTGGKAFLEKTLRTWAGDALGKLARDLPEIVVKVMRNGLPATPAALLRKALTDDLFAGSGFAGVLAPLRAYAVALCDAHLAALPPFTEPPVDATLAAEAAFADLDKALRALTRAIAFARWRRAAQPDCMAAFLAIVGRPKAVTVAAPPHEQPLSRQVEALADIVRASAPAGAALRFVQDMQRELATRHSRSAEIARARKAAEALAELFPIGDLVREQLDGLRRRLDGDTTLWMERLYRAATVGTAPNPRRSAVDPSGKLDVLVERNGTLVGAEHIGNASFLRAYLTAFLIAFWKHVRDARGGLSLLVLDDPQELLDPNNRRLLADGLGHLLGAGATLLVSTHDSRFALEVCGSRRCRVDLDHRSVHARNAKRPCTQLAPSVADLDRKRKAFEEDGDAHGAARDYANEFRIFIEARISDFFDQPAYAQPHKLALGKLLDELKRQSRTAEGLAGPAFDALFAEPALQSGSAFRDLLNRVHHKDAHEVTCGDVKHHVNDFDRVRRLILDAHDEHRRWLRRDPAGRSAAPVHVLDAVRRPSFGVLHRALDLAAFSSADGGGGGEGDGSALSDGWFTDKALFVLCADTLGFAAPAGSALLVEAASTSVEDHRLVVALHDGRVYARRLLRSSEVPGRVVLVAESEDPLHRPPPVVLPAEEVRLHKVVGVLFAARPVYPRADNEAFAQEFHPRLAQISRLYQARGSSGVPLVLDGQTVLGGVAITSDGIDQYRRRLVAVCTDDGEAIFKRVGDPLPGLPWLRLFESVGGLGDSRVIQMEDVEGNDAAVPRFVGAREVIGVLYG